jgi:hypothetical protein
MVPMYEKVFTSFVEAPTLNQDMFGTYRVP